MYIYIYICIFLEQLVNRLLNVAKLAPELTQNNKCS